MLQNLSQNTVQNT